MGCSSHLAGPLTPTMGFAQRHLGNPACYSELVGKGPRDKEQRTTPVEFLVGSLLSLGRRTPGPSAVHEGESLTCLATHSMVPYC